MNADHFPGQGTAGADQTPVPVSDAAGDTQVPSLAAATALSSAWTQAHGAALRTLRKAAGILQDELARAVGQPRSVVSNWETATRRPPPTAVPALAQAFGTDVAELAQALSGVGESGSPPSDRPSPHLPGMLESLVNEHDLPLVSRFLDQVDLFTRLPGGPVFGAYRWPRLHQWAQPFRDALNQLHAASPSRAVASTAGMELANQLRTELSLGESPLPSAPAAAELFGVHLFVVALRSGPAGRLRGALVASPAVGACMLVNGGLDGQHRLHTLASLIGRALLQPLSAGIVIEASLSTPSRRDIAPVRPASVAFARQLLLPDHVLTGLSRRLSLMTPPQAISNEQDAEPRRRLVALLAQVAHTYGVPPVTAARQANAAGLLSTRELPGVLASLGQWQAAGESWREHDASAVEDPWPGRTTCADDLPAAFISLLVQAVLDGVISLGRATEVSGLGVEALETHLRDTQRFREQTPTGREEESDGGWVDQHTTSAA